MIDYTILIDDIATLYDIDNNNAVLYIRDDFNRAINNYNNDECYDFDYYNEV